MTNYKLIGADLLEYGPVSAEQIRIWITEGRVNAETQLQAEGTAEWRPLAEVPEFAVASPGTAPPASPGFLHTRCEHCSGHIEFPEYGLETEIPCPHCETMVRLRNGMSPRARGSLLEPADNVPKKVVSPGTRVKVAEHIWTRKPEKKESIVTLYLASGAGYILLLLCFYLSGLINPSRDWLVLLAVGACSALIVVAFHLDWRRDKKRTEAMANLAMRLGLQFTAEALEGFRGRQSDGTIPPPLVFNDIHLFTVGHSRESRNVMQGELDGMTVSLFDYSYATGSGKSRHDYHQTVVGLSLPTLRLPAFVIKPENIFHKIGSAFGMQDIDFPEAPNFSKRFLLRGVREHAIRAAFKPSVLSFFEHHEGMSAEGCGNHLIYYRAGRAQQPIDIRGFMRQGCELAKLLAG